MLLYFIYFLILGFLLGSVIGGMIYINKNKDTIEELKIQIELEKKILKTYQSNSNNWRQKLADELYISTRKDLAKVLERNGFILRGTAKVSKENKIP